MRWRTQSDRAGEKKRRELRSSVVGKSSCYLLARPRRRKHECWSSCASEIHVGWKAHSKSERKTNKQTHFSELGIKKSTVLWRSRGRYSSSW